MFPTRVGMNRCSWNDLSQRCGVPHASGDEPDAMGAMSKAYQMFPTRVGMNRSGAPAAEHTRQCSPREWG